MKTLRCQQCGSDVKVPDVDWTLRTRIGALRQGQPRVAASKLREATSLTLFESETLVDHLTRERATCRGCQANLANEVGACTRCQRLNVDWLGATDPR